MAVGGGMAMRLERGRWKAQVREGPFSHRQVFDLWLRETDVSSGQEK